MSSLTSIQPKGLAVVLGPRTETAPSDIAATQTEQDSTAKPVEEEEVASNQKATSGEDGTEQAEQVAGVDTIDEANNADALPDATDDDQQEDDSPGWFASIFAPKCREDWSVCVDNEELIDDYRGIWSAKWECKRVANNRSRFGDIKFSGIPFGAFLNGDDYPKTGTIRLFEVGAEVPNAFGGYVRRRVGCTYDLKTEKVINITY